MQMPPRNLSSTALGALVVIALSICLVFLAPGKTAWADDPLYEISVLVSPLEGGDTLGEGMYHEGESVCLSAFAAQGFKFKEWTEHGELVSTQPSYCFHASDNREITAHFAPDNPSYGMSGRSWGGLEIIPNLSLTKRLDLRLAPQELPGGWTWRFSSALSDSTWTSLQIHSSGRLGDIQANAGVRFNPAAAAYNSGFLAFLWRGAGLTTGLRVNHSLSTADPPASRLLYSWTLRATPIFLSARFDQHETGIEFRDMRANISGIEICCGIVGRGVLSLTKEGFDYFRISLPNVVQLDWGISMDLDVRYGLDEKDVSVTPRWKLCGGPCVVLYGGIADQDRFNLRSVELYGFKIDCCLEDRCPPGTLLSSPYLELAIALDPDNARRVPVGFRGDEFQYLGLGLCGPACCGEGYSIELGAYFQPQGQLFGLSRVVIETGIPILPGFIIQTDVELSAGDGVTELEVGWRWDF